MSRNTRALKAAFPLTVPILAGFIFLGITCGVYAQTLGLPWWVPSLMAIAIFAGSAEFVVASFLAGPFAPLQTFITVLVINARHLFYGISMLERFRDAGAYRPYLVFAMCDESFSIEYANRAPQGVDEHRFMFFISLLNQLYWVVGCTLGSLCGSMIALTVEGIDFAMTALFVVIFLDQWLRDPSHAGELAGIVASVVAVLLFGADGFIIPAMVAICAVVLLIRNRIEPRYRQDGIDATRREAEAGSALRKGGDNTPGTLAPSAGTEQRTEGAVREAVRD